MRQRRKTFRGFWFLSFGIFLLLELSNLAYSGTRFKPTYRVCPPCNYNPYDAGSIAVVATEKSEEVEAVVSGVAGTLSRDGFFKLVAREQVEAVLKEQAFGLSGFVDPQKAAGVGKLIGADSIFVLQFGGFSSSDNQGEASVEFQVSVDKKYWRVFHAETGEEYEPKGRQTAPVKVPYVWEEKIARASASGALINTSTAQQLCSGFGTAETKVMGVKQSGDIEVTSSFKDGDYNWYLSSDGVAVAKKKAEESYKQAIKTSSEIVDYGKLPSDAILKPELIRKCSPKVAIEIIPPLVTREREVGDGKTRMSKAAVLKGKGGAWDEAEKLLLLAVSAEPRDHNAWGGLGICYEYKEMKTKARECYSKARQLDPKNKGFPNWLKEIDYMLNDKSSQYEAPESEIPEFESLPYVVMLEGKNRMRINPQGKVGKEGDIVKVFSLKIVLDPETNEVLETEKEPKAIAIIVKATDKLWTTLVLKERKGINVQDKVEIMEPGRKGYLPLVTYRSGQKEIILDNPGEENKLSVGSKLTIVKSKYKVDFDKSSQEYSIETEDKVIGEVVITEIEDSQVKAKFLEGPKEKPEPERGEFWGKI